MRLYEIIVIVDSVLEDDQIDDVLGRMTDLVNSQDGAIVRLDKWGRRKLSFEIADRWEGYYIIVEFQGQPELAAELDRTLSLADEVLRHKILRIPEKASQARAPKSQAAVASAS